MTHQEMADGLMEQARSSLEGAKKAAQDGHWAYAVRTSQDASELCIKALLIRAGTEPPRVHDLAHALHEHRDRLTKLGLDRDEVDHMAKVAADLAEDRSKALYGDEKHDIPANQIYGEKDAHHALRAAEYITRACTRERRAEKAEF